MKYNLHDIKGSVIGEIELNDNLFACEVNESVLHQVIVAMQNNSRQGTHSNLTRAEVRGGGKKPWRQKHTGRARQGSIRSPQWDGGGIVFAKKPRSYSQKVNKKMKLIAFTSILSAKVKTSSIVIVDDIKLKSIKTKDFNNILSNLKINKSTLLLLDSLDNNVIKSARNIATVSIANCDNVSSLDILQNQYILTTQSAIRKIEELLA